MWWRCRFGKVRWGGEREKRNCEFGKIRPDVLPYGLRIDRRIGGFRRLVNVPVMIEMGTLAIFTSSMSAFKALAAGSDPSAATSMGGASSSSSIAAKTEFLQQ